MLLPDGADVVILLFVLQIQMRGNVFYVKYQKNCGSREKAIEKESKDVVWKCIGCYLIF